MPGIVLRKGKRQQESGWMNEESVFQDKELKGKKAMGKEGRGNVMERKTSVVRTVALTAGDLSSGSIQSLLF